MVTHAFKINTQILRHLAHNFAAVTADKGNHKPEEKQTIHHRKRFLCHMPFNSINFRAFHLAVLSELTPRTLLGLLYLVCEQLRFLD